MILLEMFGILTRLGPLFWVSETDRILASSILLWCKLADYFIKVNFHVVVEMEQGVFCQSRLWQDFNLESFLLLLKNTIVMKNINFCKTVETGVDPRLHWLQTSQ